jgi:hypothetical protein
MAERQGGALLPRRRRRAVRRFRILLPPSLRSGVVERQDARLLIVRRRFESCRRSCTTCPRGRRAMTPGPQPGSCGFESRRGCSTTGRGGIGTPPASGAGDCRFDPCRPDTETNVAPSRGRGEAVLASLMSSRPWVRIPPAQLQHGGVAQTGRALACQARRRRFESGRPRSYFVVAVV